MRRDLIAYMIAISATIGAKAIYDESLRKQGALREQLRAADSTVVALTQRARVTDTVYRADTIRLTRRLTQWDTVTRVVAAIPDTVHVPVEVVRFIAAAADSTIRECRIVVQTCEQRVAQRDSLLVLRERQMQIMASQRPSFLRKWGERVALVGAGVLLAR